MKLNLRPQTGPSSFVSRFAIFANNFSAILCMTYDTVAGAKAGISSSGMKVISGPPGSSAMKFIAVENAAFSNLLIIPFEAWHWAELQTRLVGLPESYKKGTEVIPVTSVEVTVRQQNVLVRYDVAPKV